MQLAILSDMHVPGQADGLPESFRDHVRAADHVVHAGDFGSHEALATVRDLADGLTAVYGNADPPDVGLPPVASVEAGGVTFVVLHGVVNPVERAVFDSEGVVTNREDWLDAVADTARARAGYDRGDGDDGSLVGVAGHSHVLEDVTHDGIRLLNPGTSTGVESDGAGTMLTAEVADGEVDVTVHEA